VRDLSSARDQLRATLNDTREELQLDVNKLNALECTGHSAVRQVERAAQPVPAPQGGGRNRYEATRWRRPAGQS
jgi:ABC-type transporter Mla subunit MlaD